MSVSTCMRMWFVGPQPDWNEKSYWAQDHMDKRVRHIENGYAGGVAALIFKAPAAVKDIKDPDARPHADDIG